MSFNARLGMTRAPDGAIHLEAGPAHEVAPGVVHFAVLATLAEVSAAGTVDAGVVPAQVSLSLLSVARPGLLVARGRLLRRGRKLAVATGDVFQGDKLVATATVSFAILDA